MKAVPLSRDYRLWSTLPAAVQALVITDARGRVSTVARPTFPVGVCATCGCTESDPCVDAIGECCAWWGTTRRRCTFCHAGVVRQQRSRKGCR